MSAPIILLVACAALLGWQVYERTSVMRDLHRSRGDKPEATYDAKKARELWVREDDLVNHRITWFGVLQGLMFTAYSVTLNDKDCGARCLEFKKLLPIVGFSLNVAILVGILAAILAACIIHRRNAEPDKTLGIHSVTTVGGWLCAVCIPIVFGVLWLKLIWVGANEKALSGRLPTTPSSSSVPVFFRHN